MLGDDCALRVYTADLVGQRKMTRKFQRWKSYTLGLYTIFYWFPSSYQTQTKLGSNEFLREIQLTLDVDTGKTLDFHNM